MLELHARRVPCLTDLMRRRHLRWRVPLDPGRSTPILHGGKVLLTTYRAESKELATVALDRDDRAIALAKPACPRAGRTDPPDWKPRDGDGRLRRPTHICLSSAVRVCFATTWRGASCGNSAWDRSGTSMALAVRRLFLRAKLSLTRTTTLTASWRPLIVSPDASSGRTPRPDAVRSYSTPVVWTQEGRPEIIVAGALQLSAYDPANGERLWWANGLARIVIPTPVTSGPMIYMASWSPGGDPGKRLALDPWPMALSKWDKNHDGKLAKAEIDDREVLDRFNRMDLDQNGLLDQQEWEHHAEFFRRAQNAVLAIKPSGRGELGESAVIWKHSRGVPYVATPVLDQGILWMVKDGGNCHQAGRRQRTFAAGGTGGQASAIISPRPSPVTAKCISPANRAR